MPYNQQLQCDALDFCYDPDTGNGILLMAAGDCCDMAGCVAFFENIDAKVNSVDTFSGSVHDTIYSLRNGRWTAFPAGS